VLLACQKNLLADPANTLPSGNRVRKSVVAILILPGLLSSCATILKGRTEEITVISYPAGAKVLVNGDEKGVTPLEVKVPSKADLNVYVTKEGYRPADLNDPATTRWGYEAFSFACGVLPVFGDLGTGAAWGHDHLMLTTHLKPGAQARAEAAAKDASEEPEPLPEGSPYAEVKPEVPAAPAAKASPGAQQSPTAVSTAAVPTRGSSQPGGGTGPAAQ